MAQLQSSGVASRRHADGVAVIEFARPEANNVVDLESLDALSALIDAAIADDDVKAIVLAGQGRHFCAGASPALLAHLQDAGPLVVQDNVYSTAQGAARRLYNCRKPTVAAVSGAAITVGCGLAIACDFRLVDDTAYFQEAWIRVGLLPPLGGLFLLPRMIGAARAAEMVLQGRKVKAIEAIEIGLANTLAPTEHLLERACELAAELGALPPQAYRLAKAGLHRALESTMDAEWATNALAQSILVSSEDFAEGVSAAKERRAPKFIGR